MMNKNRINTISVREIKYSFKRFLSLLVMSMLGVGVFVGIKMAAPDMLKSLDSYYDENNFYDIKIISTLGLTDDDIKALSDIDTVEKVYGSYSKDVLIKINGAESVIKVISLNENVNKIQILKGRMPLKNNEIVVEKTLLDHEKLKIGDKITLLDDNGFKNKKLTIVGIVKSPLYITNTSSTLNRGNTNLGTGKINYYTYIANNNFNLDYYTEIYITVKKAKSKTTNSSSYNELVNKTINNINKIKLDRQNNRYNEIYSLINDEITKNEVEGQSKINSAEKLLNDTNKQLINGKNILDNTKKELDSSLIKLNELKARLDNAKLALDNNKIKLDSVKLQMEEGKSKINEKLQSYNLTFDDINKFEDTINNIDISKDEIINLIPTDIPNYDEIIDIIDMLYELNLDDTLKDYIVNPDSMDDLINLIPMDTPNYDEIVETINNIMQFYNSVEKIKEVQKAYDNGINLYNASLLEYNNGYNTYINYYNEYQNGLALYNNGLNKYNNNLNLYNSKLQEYYNSKRIFELEIMEAKKKLEEIPESTWYVYDRFDDNGYSNYIDDGNSVSNLSKVFPSIFFVVAVLISLISMSRMVEDDRINIGTLKSLGFKNRHIRKKYLLYSGIATILGGIIGSLLGFFLLPRYIWSIYKILFDVPKFKYDYNPINIIIGIAISFICICGTTLLTIRKVVKEKPSDLMRPKAPENGKRVILEKIPLIWNRIKFSNKITIRNLFRYRKRVFMTIVGILGCTALMLAGFGIRNSVVSIPNKQYNEIFNFDEMIYLTGNDINTNEIFNNKHIVNRLDTKMDISMSSKDYDINLFVPENENDIKNVLNLKDVKTGKILKLYNNKVIITDKLAELENKKVGDKIKITNSDNKEYEFIISGICENYVGHYIFMNKETYEKNIGTYVTNIVYLNIDNLKNEDALSKTLMKDNNVISIISIASTINTVNNMLESLNSVVLILIFLSGALSFVVLYNLSYINISERKREIATLKVLGFTDKEVDNYITKETIILTLIGIILGLIFGIFLTNVIVDTVEIEMVRFLHNIKIFSFIITSIIVMLFTLLVNRIIHYALKKIDMIESLKSVE